MSRGPGKWQRMILDALRTEEWIYVWEVLPDPCTEAQYSAVMRAADGLRKKGVIKIHSKAHQNGKHYKVAVRMAPGELPQVWAGDKISVENVNNGRQIQHLQNCRACGNRLSEPGGIGVGGDKYLCGVCVQKKIDAFLSTLPDDEKQIFSTWFRIIFKWVNPSGAWV